MTGKRNSATRLARILQHALASEDHIPTCLSPGTCSSAGIGNMSVAIYDDPLDGTYPRDATENLFKRRDLKTLWLTEGFGTGIYPDVVALVTVKKPINDHVLSHFPSVKLVAVAFTGYDHVDMEACRKRGIVVANVPNYSTNGAAELVFGLIFSLLRNIPTAHQNIRNGFWNFPPGNELSGKRMALMGTGNFGMRVSEIAKAFKVSKLIGYDPVINPRFLRLGGEYVQSLATLFLHADVVVIACTLTAETRGIVNAKLLKLLRPDSLLINCARGAIVDQDALATMLEAKSFKAGLDVYEVEPLPSDHRLRNVPESQLVMTPHLAYKCNESLRRRAIMTYGNIMAFLVDDPQNVVS